MTLRRAPRILLLSVFSALLALQSAPPATRAAGPINFTILHTNDFHGQLQASGSNPGLARVASVVNGVRTSVGADNTLLVDGGDEMQGSLLSNLQKGAPTIAAFNAMGTQVATFGNHEFDWGQENLAARTTQASYPFVSANIVVNDTGSCGTAGWTSPAFTTPYSVETVAGVRVAFVGVTTTETPTITVATATQGLCFKDPFDSIVHYYDTMKANADVIVVLSHLGFVDGGYGYGIPVYGDQTLADKLFKAGKYVPLIIGGHSHTNVGGGGTNPNAAIVDSTTTVVQAYYNGRVVGRADLAFDTATGKATVGWTRLAVSTTGTEDATVKGVIDTYASDAAYQALVNQPIGYSAVDLGFNGAADSMMGSFVDDAIYNYLNTDGDATNDIDLFFNNAGGIRTSWCYVAGAWVNTGCTGGVHDPALLTYGNMFTVLPFGNATVVGKMTGAQILQVLNQGPQVSNGVIQPAGLKYTYYAYKKVDPTSTATPPAKRTYAWGAYDYCIVNKSNGACDPIDMDKTYKVGTNEFLAPAGGDGYGGFKYMTDVTYWGDMLNAVDAYVSAHYGTAETAYKGPTGDGSLDGRIVRDGDDNGGSITPITVLHNNDSHGNLVKTGYVGYDQLATIIGQERYYNSANTILLNGGDQIQGDAMMYYFKSSYSGFAADGTPLPDALKTNPMMAIMNALGYNAMVLGNHEFNYGSDVFKGVLSQANFPILGANVSDDGRYGLKDVNGGAGVQPYVELNVNGVKVAVIGITNHRVPNYELPSNIPGLTFSDPMAAAQKQADALRAKGDQVVIALTHIGFTEDPKSVEVDANVDTNMAAQVSGLDAIIGAHSHTSPVTAYGNYKFLPTIIAGPGNTPVLVDQSYRYNNYLGEDVIGVRSDGNGGYKVVSTVGQYFAVTTSTAEDATTKALMQPYVDAINTYNAKVVGQTTVPIDTRTAFTEETNGANLQAEASVWELANHGITDVDIHISGAMTNKLMAGSATEANPVTLKISDMFAGMPYENSLVVLSMNGPQIKAVLERGYRNYYYYKYVPGYGGYSYYTTCMLDVNKDAQIMYKDLYPTLPDGNNVMGLKLPDGRMVDFSDATKFYNVSTVNYLAAGSCNMNDGGKTLWPLSQIVHDTQYYVRDAVIDYLAHEGTVSPKVEGRLLFGDTVAPVVTINAPAAQSYLHPDKLTLDFSAVDGAGGTTPSIAPVSGVKSIVADIDGAAVATGQVVDLYGLTLGDHTLTVKATDWYGNATTKSVTFSVTATVQSLKAAVNRLFAEGKINDPTVRNSLLGKLDAAQAALDKNQLKTFTNQMNGFISLVKAQSGKHIQKAAATWLVTDANWVIVHKK